MKTTTQLTLTLLLLLFTPAATAAGENLHPDQATETNSNFDDFTFTDRTNPAFLSFLFSALNTPDTVAPGDTFQIEADVTTTSYVDASDAVMIFEIYDCYDTGCDDPERDQFIEAVQSDVWDGWGTIASGESYGTAIDYTIPTDADGPHAAVAYMYNTATQEKVSDAPDDTFIVETSTDSTDNLPNADIDGPTQGQTGEQLTFDASDSTDDNGIDSYTWSVDGTQHGTGESFTRTFTNAGSYTVKILVEDTDGQTDSASRTVDINDANERPTVNTIDAPRTATCYTEISVSASASDPDGDQITYSWNNGDTGSDATFVFTSAGEKQVIVEASDGEMKDSESATIGITCQDSDGDGVKDSNDAAPNIYGSNPDGTPTLLDRVVNTFVALGLPLR